MTLTVEDGTGLAAADSYVTLEAYQAYGAAIGWTMGTSDAADEVNLRRAFQTINRKWEYLGAVEDDDQAGAFPRTLWGGVPQGIKDAQCELAHLIQGGLDPFATVAAVVASKRTKAGPVESETTYQGGLSTPRLVAVEGLLRPYLAAGAGQVRMIRG